MADINFRPLPENVLDRAQRRGWPAHDLSRHVRSAPRFLAEAGPDALRSPGGNPAADAEQIAGFRDNRPVRSKRWIPLVVPLMALMLVLATGSVLLLET
jgi:hypothetical protein